jgi:hypothetical protein
VAATLEQVRAQQDILFFPGDPKREPRSFTLTLNRPMGQKRGRAEGSFVRETRAQAVTFYRDLVQNLKAWQAPPPKIRTEPDPPASASASPPDALPLLPKDVLPPGTSNDDMFDFAGDVAPVQARNEPAGGEVPARQDGGPEDSSPDQAGERIQDIGKSVVAEHGDALGILAEHDSEPFRS